MYPRSSTAFDTRHRNNKRHNIRDPNRLQMTIPPSIRANACSIPPRARLHQSGYRSCLHVCGENCKEHRLCMLSACCTCFCSFLALPVVRCRTASYYSWDDVFKIYIIIIILLVFIFIILRCNAHHKSGMVLNSRTSVSVLCSTEAAVSQL